MWMYVIVSCTVLFGGILILIICSILHGASYKKIPEEENGFLNECNSITTIPNDLEVHLKDLIDG